MIREKINEIIERINSIEDFSGAVLIKEKGDLIFKDAFGFADISNSIKNSIDTRFGIASGAKLITGISVCKLVDDGIISFDTLLKDCINIEFPYFDDNVTIHHLLTHSSGIPEYYDEENMEEFGGLWKNVSMYSLRSPRDFIPMIETSKMKFVPGEKFDYNNAAFVVLGLVIEHLSGMSFIEYVKKNIFDVLEMNDSGYFPLDMLPKNCAYGYIENTDGTLKTNIYSIPVVGGPDGGVFTTVEDMSKLWKGLINFNLLSKEITNKLLTPHVYVHNDVYYGYGVWIIQKDDGILKYYLDGGDPGVRFMSSFYPSLEIEVTAIANREFGPYDISMFVESLC